MRELSRVLPTYATIGKYHLNTAKTSFFAFYDLKSLILGC